MTTEHDHRPRPYTTLRNGQIVWVTPEEHAAGKPTRSRLETDDEVRVRIRAKGWTYWDPTPDVRNMRGKVLDEALKRYNLPPRAWLEE